MPGSGEIFSANHRTPWSCLHPHPRRVLWIVRESRISDGTGTFRSTEASLKGPRRASPSPARPLPSCLRASSAPRTSLPPSHSLCCKAMPMAFRSLLRLCFPGSALSPAGSPHCLDPFLLVYPSPSPPSLFCFAPVSIMRLEKWLSYGLLWAQGDQKIAGQIKLALKRSLTHWNVTSNERQENIPL